MEKFADAGLTIVTASITTVITMKIGWRRFVAEKQFERIEDVYPTILQAITDIQRAFEGADKCKIAQDEKDKITENFLNANTELVNITEKFRFILPDEVSDIVEVLHKSIIKAHLEMKTEDSFCDACVHAASEAREKIQTIAQTELSDRLH